MKKITLTQLHLENFKGVVNATYDFGETTEVRGGNGTGKSTIYEAYTWALFKKNPYGNEPSVQPLDEKNEPKHNLVTSVTVSLLVDGLPIKFEHRMEENWSKSRGTSEMKMTGLTHSYLVNDVPMSESDYKAKLNGIANMEDWFMLSSINILPNMKMEDRRIKLQSIAPAFNESTIMAKYPAIAKAAAEGKSVKELKAQNDSNKTKAKEQLDVIPARIDEQERGRVEVPEDAQAQIADAEANIAKLKAREQELRSGYVVESTMELQNELREVNFKIAQEEQEENRAYLDEHAKRTGALRERENALRNEQLTISMAETDIKNCKRQIEEGTAKVDELRAKWKAEQEKQYEAPEVTTVCPTCGQPLQELKVEAAKAKALEVWRKKKAETMGSYVEEANKIKSRVLVLKDELKNLEERLRAAQTNAEAITADVSAKRTALEGLTHQEPSEAYKAAVARHSELTDQIEASKERMRSANEEAQSKIDAVVAMKGDWERKLIALQNNVAANKKIDARVAELQDEQRTLAQALADAENVEAQIAAYKKEYITEVERSVSSLFRMVRWKMYQANISRDGEKPICQPIIDGIPYEQQNRATQMNAGVDMINGFSAGLGICVPLFIDNKESVSELIETESQTITLTVAAGEELTINSL